VASIPRHSITENSMKKVLLTSLILTVGLTNCKSQTDNKQEDMFGLFKKQEPIEKFWNWFKSNEKSLRDFQKNPDKTLTQVLNNIKKIQSGLAVEFKPPKNDIINVTISADGDRNNFTIVQEIVAKAPKIEGYSFVAFRQRMPTEKVKGMVLKAEDHELNPDNMKFFPIISGDTLDIIIYANKVTEENYNQIAYGGLMLIDNILGEYDCVTKVRTYDFQNMPTEQKELKELKPLLELAEFVDNFHKKNNN
jgi:hypothetical protein